MRRTIMYYPNIQIPDGGWLRKSLLYWDEVSSIVPRGIEHELYANSYTIAELREEGEYRAIYPDQLMNSNYFGDFEAECIYKIKWYSQRKRASSRTFHSRIHNDKLFSHYDIHNDKLSHKIMGILEQSGMVSLSENWVSLDNQLADIYMSTLAKYSALSDVNHTVIGTDRISSINKIYPIKYASKQAFGYKIPIINLSLNILPTPSPEVPYKKIIEFKKKYREELLSFRNQINRFEEEISNSNSEDEIKERTIQFKEGIEQGTRETIRMLNGSRINFFFSSLKSIINLKSPTMIATYAAIAGNNLVELHPAVTLAGIGMAGTVDLSVNYMSINRATREKLADKGFLYLYYANRKGIVNDFI